MVAVVNKRMKSGRSPDAVRRRGFTLIELLVVIAIMAVFSATSLFAAKEQLDIRKMGDWRIVVPPDAIGSETYAAQEFQTFFQEATGFDLPIGTDAGEAGNVFIGPSDALRDSSLGFAMGDAYDEEELCIVVRPDHIAVTGGRPRGTLLGVYEFLEGVLGIRFLTNNHTYYPPHLKDGSSDISAERADVDYIFNPRFSYRLLYYPEVLYQVPFSRRIRCTATSQPDALNDEETNDKIGGWAPKSTYLHSINSWADVSHKEHPEYFAFKDGKRWSRTVCLSHPEIIEIIKTKVLKNAKTMPRNHSFSISQEDCEYCECDRCAKIAEANGGNHSAVTLTLVNEVARELAKVRPDVTIGTLAYAWSAAPPTNMKVEQNVRIQYATYHSCFVHSYGSVECPVNLRIAEEVRGWADLAGSMVFWTYSVDFRDYLLPPAKLGSLPSQFKLMSESKGIGSFYQGPGGGWGVGMSDMMVYICSRMLWNPNLEPGLLQDEFLDLHYGRAAVPIREFLTRIRRTMSAWPLHENCNGPFYRYGLTEELGHEGVDYFDEALELAESDAIRDRVEKASICALRLAMGTVWYGTSPENLTPELKADYRSRARKIFALCEKHGVNQHGESWPIKGAKAEIRKALRMGKDEPF